MEVEAFYEVSSQKWQFLVRIDTLDVEEYLYNEDTSGYLIDAMQVAMEIARGS